MKFSTYLLSVSLWSSFLLNLTSAEEASCPCFSASDVAGNDYSEFIDGGVTTGPDQTTALTYILTFGPQQSYSAIQRGSAYECEVIKGTSAAIDFLSQQQFEHCRELLSTTQPTMQQVEQELIGKTVILQNQGTGRFVTANEDGSITSRPTSSPRLDVSVHGQWIVRPEDCPSISNINLSERSCFTLYSVDFPSLKLGSDGRQAWGLRPQDSINASRYIIEPLQCSRSLSSCIARIKLAVYGDRVAADSTAESEPTRLPLARGADIEELTSEWYIEVL